MLPREPALVLQVGTTDNKQNYITLNRMQSLVQPTAMSTNENLLIAGESIQRPVGLVLTLASAPTGAVRTAITDLLER